MSKVSKIFFLGNDKQIFNLLVREGNYIGNISRRTLAVCVMLIKI